MTTRRRCRPRSENVATARGAFSRALMRSACSASRCDCLTPCGPVRDRPTPTMTSSRSAAAQSARSPSATRRPWSAASALASATTAQTAPSRTASREPGALRARHRRALTVSVSSAALPALRPRTTRTLKRSARSNPSRRARSEAPTSDPYDPSSRAATNSPSTSSRARSTARSRSSSIAHADAPRDTATRSSWPSWCSSPISDTNPCTPSRPGMGATSRLRPRGSPNSFTGGSAAETVCPATQRSSSSPLPSASRTVAGRSPDLLRSLPAPSCHATVRPVSSRSLAMMASAPAPPRASCISSVWRSWARSCSTVCCSTMKRTTDCCVSLTWAPSGNLRRGMSRRSATPRLPGDASPTTATATPPFSASVFITSARSRRSSRSLIDATGTSAISPPLMASKAGGRLRSVVAHSTRLSSPAPPPSSSVPSGRAPRHTSRTVITAVSISQVPAAVPTVARSRPLQVALQLPARDLAAVLTPLRSLGLEESIREVVAERVANDVVGLAGVHRVLEVVGQQPHVASLELDLVEAEQRLLDRRGQGEAALHAVEAAAQHHGERQVGVARRVGAAQLHAHRFGPRDVGNADQRAPVGASPREEDRRFEAAHQPLVGIDQRRENQAHPLGVVQLAGDEVLGDVAEAVVVSAGEGIAGADAEQALVHVHAAARLVVEGLGHEAGDDAGALGDGLQGEPEGHDGVGRGECIAGPEIHLVLPGGHLVMGAVDLHAHRPGRSEHRLAQIGGTATGDVEVAHPVVGAGPGDALRIQLEEEELDLRSHPVSIAEGVGVVDGSLQCAARVAGVRLALRRPCPADQASGRLRGPGQHLERGRVGHQVHVALGGAREALD